MPASPIFSMKLLQKFPLWKPIITSAFFKSWDFHILSTAYSRPPVDFFPRTWVFSLVFNLTKPRFFLLPESNFMSEITLAQWLQNCYNTCDPKSGGEPALWSANRVTRNGSGIRLSFLYPVGIPPSSPRCLGLSGQGWISTKIDTISCIWDTGGLPYMGFTKIFFSGRGFHCLAFLSFPHFIHSFSPACQRNTFLIAIISMDACSGAHLPVFANFFLHNGYKSVIMCASTSNWKKVMETINGKDN